MRRIRWGWPILAQGILAVTVGVVLIILALTGYYLLDGPNASLLQIGLGISVIVIGLVWWLVGKAALSDPTL